MYAWHSSSSGSAERAEQYLGCTTWWLLLPAGRVPVRLLDGIRARPSVARQCDGGGHRYGKKSSQMLLEHPGKEGNHCCSTSVAHNMLSKSPLKLEMRPLPHFAALFPTLIHCTACLPVSLPALAGRVGCAVRS